MKSQKSKASGQEQNQITKLMKKKYATKEYQDIVKFQQKLQSVPNYTDYFLLQGFSICNPDILSDSDLENFDKKCSALKKMDITRENVNSSLDRLSAINMPYGGIDVGDYIIKVDLNGLKMAQLNDALINLLLKGIVSMNKKHVYHVDIKDSNVLIDQSGDNKHLYARLIDWGLSASYDCEKQVPKTMRNRPFQFNVPFSSILFNSLFTKMYADFLKKNPNPSYISIRTFVIKYVVAWIAKRGSGHLKNINGVFKKFFDEELKNVNIDESYKNNLIIFDYTFYFIFEYITQILFKFTKNNQMDLMDYFSNVYVKNIDIWGFVMIYLPIMEQLHNNYNKLNEAEKQIIQEIKKMIMFILSASTTPINVDKLVEQLKVLNGLFINSHKHNNILWNMGQGLGNGIGRGNERGNERGNRKKRNSQFSYTTNMVSTTTTTTSSSSSSIPPFSRKREKVKRSKTRKRHNRK
jgi:serine/threonine protein kinase